MRSILIAVALLAATPAFAADMPKPTLSFEGVPSGKYNLDKSHANILFTISHMGFSNYIGRFNELDATFFLDGNKPTDSSVKFTVDINSIDTNNTILETKLKDKDWFDAKSFPTATFTSTRVQKTSDNTAKVTGDLSIKGTTRPATFDVTFNGTAMNPYEKKQALGFSATGTIKRSEFGLKEYIGPVGDDVKLTIEAEFQYGE